METKDFTTDDSLPFLLLLKEAGALPEWLESVPEPQDVKDLPSVAFADTGRRMMPIHNKQACYLSAVGSVVYDYPPGSWEPRLIAACHHYGIGDLVKQAHDILAPEEYHGKQAAETEKIAHALEIVVEPGQPAQQFYPIHNREAIEDSAMKMAADLQMERLPGTWFAEAVDALVKAAESHGMPLTALPLDIRRMAEDRLPSPEYLSEQIERRAKQANLPDEVVEIYKEAALSTLEGESTALDAAHVWELADRKFGIRLTDTLASPVSSFRSGMTRSRFEKMAGEVMSVAGVNVPFNQLTVLPNELVAAVLPTKVASVVLAAKAMPDGVKAAGHLAQLDEAQQLQVLEFLTESASA